MTAILLCVGAYVMGSIPFGVVVARLNGVDLRTVGSGNIGATNVARALGKGWAIVVLAADAAKGFVPVWLGRRLGLSPSVVALAGFIAIVGHMFTIFLRGRGGKGVATSLGVALALSPLAALTGFAVYIVIFAATRLSSLGSLLGVWTFSTIIVVGRAFPWPYDALAIGGAALVTLRHRQNITRLVRGEEKRT
jgi:acyl phosphate:glycerol-3-phosphate acyltransferase